MITFDIDHGTPVRHSTINIQANNWDHAEEIMSTLPYENMLLSIKVSEIEWEESTHFENMMN